MNGVNSKLLLEIISDYILLAAVGNM